MIGLERNCRSVWNGITDRFKTESLIGYERNMHEMIRELIDIGIAYKDAKKNPSSKQLSAFEEEVLKKLCSLTAASNKMITNQYNLKDSPYKTMQELVDSIKESASIDLNKFKERLEE